MCDCAEKVGRALRYKGLMLNRSLLSSRVIIPLYRRDKAIVETRRGKPSYIVASHCPFCGEEYPFREILGDEREVDLKQLLGDAQ